MKAALRTAALARRDAIPPDVRASWSRIIAERIAAFADHLPSGPVAGYWPIRSEADPRPALAALRVAGHASLLPVVGPERLMFRLWAEADTLHAAPFGLMEPLPAAPLAEPATLLVPLAAFDRRGHRIGYGKGHYDRTFARMGRVLTLGIAFATQEIDEIPAEPHDHPLDYVISERDIIDCRRSRN